LISPVDPAGKKRYNYLIGNIYMNIFSLISYSVSIASFIMAVYVLTKNFKSPLNWTFFLLVFFMSAWSFCFSFFYSAGTSAAALVWYRAGVLFLYPSSGFLLHFSLVLTGKKRVYRNLFFSLALYTIPVVLMIITLNGGLALEVVGEPGRWINVFSTSSILSIVILLYIAIPSFIALALFGRYLYRQADKRKRKQVLIIIVSIIVPVLLNLLLTAVVRGLEIRQIPEVTQYFSFVTLFGFWFAIFRYKLMVINPADTVDTIMSSMHDAVFYINNEGTIITVNHRLCNMIWYNKDELNGRPAESILETSSRFLAMLNEQTTIPVSYIEDSMLKTRMGTRIPVRLTVSSINNESRIIGFMLVCHDLRNERQLEIEIAEREMVYKALAGHEEQYRLTLDGLNDPVMVLDTGSRIKFCNSAMLSIFKIFTNSIDAITDTELELASPEMSSIISQHMPEVLRLKKVHVNEGRIIREDWIMNYELRLIPIVNEEIITSVIAVLHDITEIKRSEKIIQHSEKIESLGLLAGGIAHDFNNTLVAIMGNISLARTTLQDSSDITGLLKNAENAAIQARHLTSRLMSFSRDGELVLQTGSITGIIKDTADFCFSGSEIDVQLNFSESDYPVSFDTGQISSVFYNIFLNAKQLLTDGGTVTVDVTHESVNEHSSILLIPDEYMVVKITDTGPGIDDEHLEKIFDPYFTTRKEGHGLGLAISFSIIKRHGGLITVCSEKDEFTCFAIYLPIAHKSVIENKQQEQLANKSYRILLMDDNNEILTVSSRLLKTLGHDVEVVSSGEDAIELYRANFSNQSPYDLVILDLTVKGGMGGHKTLAAIKKIDPGVMAMVCSGYCNDPVLANFRDFGFSGILKKPFTLKELDRAIQNSFQTAG
jgi:two-component system cell cycle sensor histidine kinase/response regulator CckA